MTQRQQAVLWLLAAALLWSTGGVLIKGIGMSGLTLSGWRCLLGACFFWLVFRPRLFSWPAAQWHAALAMAACVTTFVCSTKLTTSANAILLQYTAPVYVAVLAPRLLGERTYGLDWLMIFVTMAGMGLFFLDQLSPAGLIGNIMAIGSGLFFAAIPLAMRRLKSGLEEAAFLGCLIAATASLPWLFTGLPDPTTTAGLRDWLCLLFLGFFQMGLGYTCFLKGVANVRALEAVLIPLVEPILNPLWVFLLLGERPGAFAMLGGLVVLGAVTARSVLMVRTRHAKIL